MIYFHPLIPCAVLVFFSLLTGCSSRSLNSVNGDAKFDAPLRIKLEEARQGDDASPVPCLVKLEGALDDALRQRLDNTGINVLSALNEILIVEGSPEAIHNMARLDFVKSISLSQTSNPPDHP